MPSDNDLGQLPADVRERARVAANGEVSWPLAEAAGAINALAGTHAVILGIDVQRFDDQGHTWEAAWSDFSATPRYRELVGDNATLVEEARLDALRALGRAETSEFGDWIRVSWRR